MHPQLEGRILYVVQWICSSGYTRRCLRMRRSGSISCARLLDRTEMAVHATPAQGDWMADTRGTRMYLVSYSLESMPACMLLA